MAINLDNLPQEKPAGFDVVPEGKHLVTIEGQEVKVSSAGNRYLELKLKVMTGGVIYDRIMESDKPALLYKLQRLIKACDIPMTGTLELKDIGTLIQGKQMYVDVLVKDNEWNGKITPKAEVDIFSGDIFYHINEDAPTTIPTGEVPTTPTTDGNY